ncbi:MAG: TonB-dependent receptor plug [Gemmatimonadetes bacterium]|nr:TonB-dependent receptor plug [Gemmatimonadota bacterium]
MIESYGWISRSLVRVVAALCVARVAGAQSRPCASTGAAEREPVARWSSPLDRVISVHMRDTSLRDALDRVAAVAKVRISYSPDLLPLDRAVCVSADATPVGAVLAELLVGMNVAPVAAGGDQVVLTPRPPTSAQAANPPEMARSLGMLDRVVVTGSAVGSREREITVGLDVVSGRQLARENTSNLSATLDSYVPGVWSWSQSPSNLLASYGSIRGASSFGLSYPKIYIDGIEVANPLLVSRFSPDAIDRIEVIRGPQGSALYGTDAISGVINIVTRHEGANGAGENAAVRSSAGVTQSEFAHGVLRQEHSVSLVTGSSTRSADLTVTGGSIGDFIPNGYSRDLIANGSARVVGARTTLNGTARFFMEDAGSARSPLLTTAAPPDTGVFASQTTTPQSVRQYTVGATGTFAANSDWTHSVVAGIDGYSLANVRTNFTPVPSILDSALNAAQGSAVRGTVRVSSVLHAQDGAPASTTYTFSAEHASLREASLQRQPASNNDRGPTPAGTQQVPEPMTTSSLVRWQNSTGVAVQSNTAINNTVFLTAGLRVEYDSRLVSAQQFATLPMLGAATVNDYGPLTVKLRAAYGKGIRPPNTLGHSEFWQTRYGSSTQPSLGAEEQSGTEVGIDVLVRHAFSMQLTRFDQRASGLIQQVAVPADSNFQSRRVTYLLENVGEISNRGWEIESSTSISRLSASGTLSFVDSRVTQLAKGYTGDLAEGARMLQVPARTGSLNLSWLGDRWFASLGGSQAFDWINYDEIALSAAFQSGTHPAKDLLGAQLRQYWRQYNGGLRLRASASRDIRQMFTVEIRGDNLLNRQRGEPDNITVVPGRSIMTGVKVKF